MAATEITDADPQDPDGSDDATGAPDSEVFEATSGPDAFGDDASSGSDGVGDEAGGDEQSPTDAGGSSSSGSSSGGSSGGSSGSSGGSSDSGTLVDSGSDGATGAPIVDASPDPADAHDSGSEASTPGDAGSMRDSGASGRADSGSPWSVAVSGGAAPGGNGAPALGDDDPAFDLDASFGSSSAWEDGGALPDLNTSPSRAVLGCGGCAVPDARGSGTAAWMLVAVGLAARMWRRRRR